MGLLTVGFLTVFLTTGLFVTTTGFLTVVLGVSLTCTVSSGKSCFDKLAISFNVVPSSIA